MAMTLTKVKVFPEPVTPNRVWYFSSASMPLTNLFIADGSSPAGLKELTILNFAILATIYKADLPFAGRGKIRAVS